MPSLPTPPRNLCILRLSAIGDTCHVVPVVRTLQQAWPDTALTWVIGRTEAKLMRLLPGVEFITIDKRRLWGSLRALRAALAGRRFDVLLHMQYSLRASLYSTQIRAKRRLGFDRARAREGQWLFTNTRIEAREREHVLDSFTGFTRALGLAPRSESWSLPVPAEALAWAEAQLPGAQPTLLVSPCSSRQARNWPAERYAAVVRHAVQKLRMRVALCGSPTPLERRYGQIIEQQSAVPVLNLIGRDTLPQLLALLGRTALLLAPDSGPVHMATLAGTPVIGLYGTTRSARSGPYRSRQWCVDAYAEAALQFRGRPADQLNWTETIEEPGVMELISVDRVIARLEQFMAGRC